METVGQQSPDPPAGVCQRRFRPQTGAAGKGPDRRQDDTWRVPIVEAPATAELSHDLGEDPAVVAEGFYEEPDEKPSDGADEDRPHRGRGAPPRGGGFPPPPRA